MCPKGESPCQERGVAKASPHQTPADRLGLAPEGAPAAVLAGGKGCTQASPPKSLGPASRPAPAPAALRTNLKRNVHEGKTKKRR